MFAVILGLIGAPVALFAGGFTIELIWAAVGSLILAGPIFIVVTLLGDTMGNILMGLGKKEGLRRQLSSDLLKAQHSMRKGRLIDAKELLDLLLVQVPGYSEALLLRAQVKMKSGEVDSARADLQDVLRVCDKNDVSRKWALGYLREINGLS